MIDSTRPPDADLTAMGVGLSLDDFGTRYASCYFGRAMTAPDLVAWIGARAQGP